MVSSFSKTAGRKGKPLGSRAASPGGALLAELRLEIRDLLPDGLVFRHAPGEKGSRHRRLRGETPGGEHIGIGQLVAARAEVAHLDVALVHEALQTVVHAPETDAEGLGDLALGHLGFVLEKAQDAEPRVIAAGPLGRAHLRAATATAPEVAAAIRAGRWEKLDDISGIVQT